MKKKLVAANNPLNRSESLQDRIDTSQRILGAMIDNYAQDDPDPITAEDLTIDLMDIYDRQVIRYVISDIIDRLLVPVFSQLPPERQLATLICCYNVSINLPETQTGTIVANCIRDLAISPDMHITALEAFKDLYIAHLDTLDDEYHTLSTAAMKVFTLHRIVENIEHTLTAEHKASLIKQLAELFCAFHTHSYKSMNYSFYKKPHGLKSRDFSDAQNTLRTQIGELLRDFSVREVNALLVPADFESNPYIRYLMIQTLH